MKRAHIEIKYGFYQTEPGQYLATVCVIDHTNPEVKDRWIYAPSPVNDPNTAMELATTMGHSIMEMLRLFGVISHVQNVDLN